MRLFVIIALSLLSYAALMGSRLAVSLATLKLTDSNGLTGVLLGLYAIMPIFLGIPAGRLLDRFGVKLPTLVASIVSLVGLCMPFFFLTVWALVIAAAASGLSFMLSSMALNNATALIGSAEKRTLNYGWVFLGNSAGMAVGPLIAGFSIDHLGNRASFLLIAGLAVASIALLVAFNRYVPSGRRAGKRAAGNLLDCLREPKLRSVLLSQVMATACLEGFYFLVPLYGHHIGLSASIIGIIISCAFVANFTSRSFMPWLLKHAEERTLVAAVMVVAGFSTIPFGLLTWPPILMVLSGGVGILHGVALPILSSLIYTNSPEGRQGEVIGARMVMSNSATSTAQLLGGSLGGIIGIAPVLWLLAAVAFTGSWHTYRHVRSPVLTPAAGSA